MQIKPILKCGILQILWYLIFIKILHSSFNLLAWRFDILYRSEHILFGTLYKVYPINHSDEEKKLSNRLYDNLATNLYDFNETTNIRQCIEDTVCYSSNVYFLRREIELVPH